MCRIVDAGDYSPLLRSFDHQARWVCLVDNPVINIISLKVYFAFAASSSTSPFVQPLGQRSKCRRSRKSKRSYIPLCKFFAVYFLCFLQAADRSSFTSRTPNKDQKVGKLFYFVIVQVSLPGDIQEPCGSRLFAWISASAYFACLD